jgi:NADH-quinone oxidoreductase subunit J
MDWKASLVGAPLVVGVVCGAVALALMLPRGSRVPRVLGGVVGLVALGLFAAGLPLLGDWLAQGLFWIMAGVTVLSAAATVAMRSAVYSALWFAMSLLGTGGLFLMQGAGFLGVATVVVYAGAIVVTFLFVLMLAQPEGHATYDRLTWSWYAKPMSVLAAAGLVAVLTTALPGIREMETLAALGENGALQRADGVLHTQHMARFGAELFSGYLVSVEVAGTLLLVALVGAVAIMIQGRKMPQAGETA